MRLMMKMMLTCLAMVGVTAQAKATQYLYEYIPDYYNTNNPCTICAYQTPFSFTYDSSGPQPPSFRYGNSYVNGSVFIDNIDGVPGNTGTISLSGVEVGVEPDRGDYLLYANTTPPMFEYGSNGSVLPAYDGDGNTISRIAAYDLNTSAYSGSFLITEISAIPEPATWAMMIVGFGLLGYVMRRRRVSYAAAVAG